MCKRMTGSARLLRAHLQPIHERAVEAKGQDIVGKHTIDWVLCESLHLIHWEG